MTDTKIQLITTRDTISENINEPVRDSRDAVQAALAMPVEKLVDEYVRAACTKAEATIKIYPGLFMKSLNPSAPPSPQ